ncbi:PqqD family protein [Sphingomonas sp. LB-2]|uniref:PqqD family protein n=1 Tax=Sphingomonas caeni TaxID=2984949 RepID=UPI00222E0D14|nr:PqqD family protein [Sphingomonas caeni]MCW3846663.1 PqqD family protein [Sphingomonas caeni]
MSEGVANGAGDERLSASEQVMAIKVEEEVIAFHMDHGRYFGLRGAAGLVWERIQAGTDRESAIAAEILASHRGDPDHIRADVAKAIAEMKRLGILIGG